MRKFVPQRWCLLVMLLLASISAFLVTPNFMVQEGVHRRGFLPKTSTTRLHMATSSSDLKKNNNIRNKKRGSKTVASRLAKAAKAAAAAQSKDEETSEVPMRRNKNQQDKGIEIDDEKGVESLPSINALSKTIDKELLRPRDGFRPQRETSSMRILLEHNDDVDDANNKKKSPKRIPDLRDVAMVFSKPLWEDHITTEYASRLVLLARAIQDDNYHPSLICFCGSITPKKNDLVSETSAGVLFFKHLCASNAISLEGINLCIVGHEDGTDASWSSSSSLHPVVEELLHRHYLKTWLEESEVYESATDEYGMTREVPRKKIRIHFTLISTDYHLCILNDIHVRSPRQSPLNVVLQELDRSIRSYRGLCETTWRFRYSTYPYVDSKDDLTAFLGKVYLLAQELRPLLVNIRGVANQEEFFQRDNYRTLVATRRSLVALLEEMNEAFRNNNQRKTTSGLVPPNLKALLQKTGVIVEQSSETKVTGTMGSSGYVSTDIVLESALLSLGRCADLVGPAGRFTSQSVSRQEWRDATRLLEAFLDLIQRACDPDRPLPADKWGKLNISGSTDPVSTNPVVLSSVADIEHLLGEGMLTI